MEYSQPRLTARQRTPRAGRDPTRLVLWALQPLLIANCVLWTAYTHMSFMSAIWFIALIGSLFFLRR